MPPFHFTRTASTKSSHRQHNGRYTKQGDGIENLELRSKRTSPSTRAASSPPSSPYQPRRTVSYEHMEEDNSSNSSGSVGGGGATSHGFGETIIPRYSHSTPGFLAVEDDHVVFLFAPQVVGSIIEKSQPKTSHFYHYHRGPPPRKLR